MVATPLTLMALVLEAVALYIAYVYSVRGGSGRALLVAAVFTLAAALILTVQLLLS